MYHHFKRKPKPFHYDRKNYIMTDAERHFFGMLMRSFGQEYLIFPQVHLSALLDEHLKGQSWRLIRFAGTNNAISHTGAASINIFAFVGGLVAITVFYAPLGALFLGVNYTMSLARRLWESNRVVRIVNRALGDAAAMTETLYMPPSIRDAANPEALRIHSSSIDLHHIRFGDKEGSATTALLEDFDLHIKPGEKVGLVGHSGGGKTTITQLLLRIMDIESGEICIDGQNIARLKQTDLRRNIAYVPQESLLFHRTLLSNIEYGKPDASRKKIEAVARMAHADDLIENYRKDARRWLVNAV